MRHNNKIIGESRVPRAADSVRHEAIKCIEVYVCEYLRGEISYRKSFARGPFGVKTTHYPFYHCYHPLVLNGPSNNPKQYPVVDRIIKSSDVALKVETRTRVVFTLFPRHPLDRPHTRVDPFSDAPGIHMLQQSAVVELSQFSVKRLVYHAIDNVRFTNSPWLRILNIECLVAPVTITTAQQATSQRE
jgi:hypothetical protein